MSGTGVSPVVKDGDPLLLAIDVGTQSVRALVFDLRGELVAARRVPIEPYFSERPGWAEQHVQVYWDAVCDSCRGVIGDAAADVDRIAGLAVTTQRATVVNLDASGEPLRPAIVWLDQRRSEHPPRLPRWMRAGARFLRRYDALREFQAEAECNLIAEQQPEVAAATDKFLLLSGYLNWRLTGRFVDSVAAQVGYLPFNYRHQRWSGPREPVWHALALRRDQLPDLVPAGAAMGRLTAEAATQTGLPAGLTVVAAGADKSCELLGSGVTDPGVAGISYGTTATINTVHDRYVEVMPPLPAYPAALPGHWNSEVAIRRGFWMVEWFRREFGVGAPGAELTAGEAPGREENDAYESLEAMLAETEPGALGLLLQPYWSPGIPFPGEEARGAIIGFGAMHGRAHVYRAIVEGIAHALYDAGRRLERRNRRRFGVVRVAGGGARSDAVMQITADVFGLPAERPRVTEASGLGAAINVAVGLGLHPGYEAAVAAMTRVGGRFEPDAANHELYRRIHNGAYGRIYRCLRPLYRELRRITGYPP